MYSKILMKIEQFCKIRNLSMKSEPPKVSDWRMNKLLNLAYDIYLTNKLYISKMIF